MTAFDPTHQKRLFLPGILPVLAVCILSVSAQENYFGEFPERSTDIYGLTATNAPIPLPTPTLSDGRKRLRQILLLDQQKKPAAYPALPERSIAGLSAKQTGSNSASIEHFNKIHVADAIRSSNILFRKGEQERAYNNLNDLLDVVTEDDLREELWSAMGVMRFKQLDYDSAAHCFEQARMYKPNDVRLACNLAAAYMSNGNLENAASLLKEIPLSLIDNNGVAVAIQFNLACIYSMMDQKSDALEHLSLAAHIDPAFTGTHIGDTQLDSIRSEKRFSAITRQIDLAINQPASRQTETDGSPTDDDLHAAPPAQTPAPSLYMGENEPSPQNEVQ